MGVGRIRPLNGNKKKRQNELFRPKDRRALVGKGNETMRLGK
jgi:hypothetical protein